MIAEVFFVGVFVVMVTLLVLQHKERQSWRETEDRLLERIQRPERPPVTAATPRPQKRERDPDRNREYARIGTVQPMIPDQADRG